MIKKEKKTIDRIYCEYCNKNISKKNIQKHRNTEKHRLKQENATYKK